LANLVLSTIGKAVSELDSDVDGCYLQNDNGVSIDLTRAARNFKFASDQGIAHAQRAHAVFSTEWRCRFG
jgi:TPR repeat protein